MTLPAFDVASSPQTTTVPATGAFEQRLEKLQQDYAELNTAIFEAAQVHRRLCAPSLVRHGGFDVASEIFAVRHLPGDFFSVEETSDGLILALGDIGGKGLAAGMWVTHLVGLIRTHTAKSSDPKEIVAGVNRDIARFAGIEPLSSLFVARLDRVAETLDYCSAGHPPALLLRANGQLELLSDGGPVLGAVPEASFDCGCVRLLRGDLLLACSDGILESFNEADQEFGNMRLQTELRRAQGGSAEAVLFSVLGAVQDFAAPRPLTDDMTLVVVKNNDKKRNLKLNRLSTNERGIVMADVKPIPEGYHSLTPYLVIDGAADAMEYYKKAFGAVELFRMEHEGKIGHAEMKVGDSPFMLADASEQFKGVKAFGGTPVSLMIYVDDVDTVYPQAIAAGGVEMKPLQNQFYGDRSGTLTDPFGHVWTIATHKEDVSPEEIDKRLAAMAAGHGG